MITAHHEVITPNPDMDIQFHYNVIEANYVSPHWHSALEILYIMEGYVTVEFSDGRRVSAGKDEFIIINTNEIHAVISKKNRAMIFQLPPEMYQKFVPAFESLYFEVDMHPEKAKDISRLKRLKSIFRNIYIIYDIQPEGWLLKFNSLLYDMMFLLIHNYSHKLTAATPNNDQLKNIRLMINFLEDHHSENICISDVADMLGYTNDYVSRIFKKHVNMTIIDYLYMIRIHHVCLDIINTNEPLENILEEHGCTNYRVFSRKFKELWGCTARDFKKKYKSNNKIEYKYKDIFHQTFFDTKDESEE